DVEVCELKMFPASMRKWQVTHSVRRERNPLAVGRPRRSEISSRPRSYHFSRPRPQIHRPKVGRAAGPSAHKHESFAVWRKRSLVIIGGAVGESFQTGSVRFHSIQICGAVALGREDDRRSIWRPNRIVVNVSWGNQWMLVATVSRSYEQANLTWLWKDPRKHDSLGLRRLCECQAGKEQ